MPKRNWTDQDIRFIRENAENMTNDDFGKHFCATKMQIMGVFQRFKIKRSQKAVSRMRGGLVLKKQNQ